MDFTVVTPCLGLTCDTPDDGDVPEAHGFATWVDGPRALEREDTAGFYDYGSRRGSGKPAIAFVVPLGQADRMPASVRRLRLVRKLETETDSFETGTVVILGHGVTEWIPAHVTSTKAARRMGRTHRKPARAADYDFYGCATYLLCLYDFDNWQGARLSSTTIGTGLDGPYCANQNSVDSDFTNNFGGPAFPGADGGDDEASSFNNTLRTDFC